jgi:hypothetical protein
MCAKTLSKTRYKIELLVFWLLTCLMQPLLANTLYFEQEAESCALRMVGNQQIEGVLMHSARVKKRVLGMATPELHAAMAAASAVPEPKAGKRVENREFILGKNFYYLATEHTILTGKQVTGSGAMARLIEVARELIASLPAADSSGLYVTAFLAQGPDPREPEIVYSTLPPDSPLKQVVAAHGFALRIIKREQQRLVPKLDYFSLKMPDGVFYLVTCGEGAPFTLSEWLQQ